MVAYSQETLAAKIIWPGFYYHNIDVHHLLREPHACQLSHTACTRMFHTLARTSLRALQTGRRKI